MKNTQKIIQPPVTVAGPLDPRREAMAQQIAERSARTLAEYDGCLREARELVRHAVSGGSD